MNWIITPVHVPPIHVTFELKCPTCTASNCNSDYKCEHCNADCVINLNDANAHSLILNTPITTIKENSKRCTNPSCRKFNYFPLGKHTVVYCPSCNEEYKVWNTSKSKNLKDAEIVSSSSSLTSAQEAFKTLLFPEPFTEPKQKEVKPSTHNRLRSRYQFSSANIPFPIIFRVFTDPTVVSDIQTLLKNSNELKTIESILKNNQSSMQQYWSELETILNQLDTKSICSLFCPYKQRTSVIESFLTQALDMNIVLLHNYQVQISSILDGLQEKKNTLLKFLYTKPWSDKLVGVLSAPHLFNDFSKCSTSIQRHIVNILLQFYMLGNMYYQPHSFSKSDFIRQSSRNNVLPFFLFPNSCAVNVEHQIATIWISSHVLKSENTPIVYINDLLCKVLPQKVGRRTPNAPGVEYVIELPKFTMVGYYDVVVSKNEMSIEIKKYFEVYSSEHSDGRMLESYVIIDPSSSGTIPFSSETNEPQDIVNTEQFEFLLGKLPNFSHKLVKKILQFMLTTNYLIR